MPNATTVVAGHARGPLLVLSEPLSFWGGVDERTGRIIDVRHPQHGRDTAGRVLVMPGGRGSSSSSSVLAELLRVGSGPCAIVLGAPDPILVLGVLVAEVLYGVRIPVVVLSGAWLETQSGDAEIAAAEGPATIRVASLA